MDWSIVQNAFGLVVELATPVIAAAVCGALVVGVLQVATQITDDVIGLAGRLVAVVLALYLLGGSYSNQIVEFTSQVWGGANYYQ